MRRADGSSVDDTLAATILWDGSEPSYEAYRIAQDRLSILMTDQRVIERYQTDVLGRARGRMMDEDNPPSFEDLDAIRQSIERDMPDQVRIHMPDANAPTQAQPAFSAAMVPDLGSSP